jgi:hypothetical protein
VSLAGFLYVTFQIYKAADFEVMTTVELLRAGGISDILIGVFLVQFPFELLLITLAVCWWLISAVPATPREITVPRSMRHPGWIAKDPRTPPQVILAALLILGFYTTPWPLYLVAAVATVIAVTIAHRRRATNGRVGARMRRTLIVISGLVFIIMVQRPTIWVPLESITTSDRGTLVAYVIAEEGPWTTLLTPQWTRQLEPGQNSVLRERTDRVTARKLCAVDLLEARLFTRVLRLRPAQLISAVQQRAVPEPLTPPCP